MLLMPDPTTAFIDPFCEHPTLSLICNIVDPITSEPYSRDPRYIARKAEELPEVDRHRRHARTSAPRPSSSSSTTSATTRASNYGVLRDRLGRGPLEQRPATRARTSATRSGHKEGYFPVPPDRTRCTDLRTEMMLTMQAVGIEVEAHHHEVATAGQCEIDMQFDTLVTMADKLIWYKYIVKNVAAQARQDGDVHAQAALRRQRHRHALPPVALEGATSRSSPATATRA